MAPAATRRVAAILVGAALGSPLAPSAAAGSVGTAGSAGTAGVVAQAAAGHGTRPEPSPGFALTVRTPSRAPAPGWTPTRPAHPAAPVARLVTGASTPQPNELVVHRGDSLWTIARRHLGPGATDTEVAAAWPHWYAANRDVIGPDPDRLLPGQVLRAPEGNRVHGQARGAHR